METKQIDRSSEVGEEKKSPVKKMHPTLRLIRNIAAIFLWSYVLVKLFIYDVDILLIEKLLPEQRWLINYKFFVIIAAIALIWLFTKNKNIIIWTLYILLYPLIVLCWKIPYFIFKRKSWNLAFAFVNGFIGFFRSLKYNFLTLTTFIIAILFIIKLTNHIIIWLSITSLIFIIGLMYAHRFMLIFKPSYIFEAYPKIVSSLTKIGKKTFDVDEDIKQLAMNELNEQQLEKWMTNLQNAVLYNRTYLLIAKKLRDYQNSKINSVGYVFNFILVLILTIIGFAGVNLGLYKINNGYFSVASLNPNFFDFIFYSFNVQVFNVIDSVSPVAPVTQIFFIIQGLLAIFLVGIFITLIFAIKKEKYQIEMEDIINKIENEGASLEEFVKGNFKLGIEQAIQELDKMKSSAIKMIYWLTENIDKK